MLRTDHKKCPFCNEEKPGSEFYLRQVGPHIYYSAFCKKCNTQYTKLWRRNNKRPMDRRKYLLKNKYGITEHDYNILLEKQGGVCAICGTTDCGTRHKTPYFVIDHSHETGEIRGLLCQSCNHGLGKFKDNPALLRGAADYLEKQDDHL